MKAAGSTAVKFDPNPLKDGVSSIYTPGDGAADVLASSRISRQINFVDDGKLFEGHFTLHTRGLKSLIQLLVDQQSEQQVIINDLQDQMHTIRQQTSKVRRAVNAAPMFVAPEGGTDTGSVPKEVEDLRRRVKRLEGFRALWGVHHEEVEALISTYGDPVVTPEEYTAYLLNLQPFRQLRSDAQNSAVSLVERRLSISAQQRSRESGSRKRVSRDDDLRSPTERDARDNSRVSVIAGVVRMALALTLSVTPVMSLVLPVIAGFVRMNPAVPLSVMPATTLVLPVIAGFVRMLLLALMTKVRV
ncbi:hypothetical protein TCDM_04271 [Trypanosoma cruzi Dm28c]|uniref:Uncharacterized protein n=1 Tax=Trypanosoma cruzi Dm28c TaxID=1416333 RepID=V5BLP5_TRYCR|nr:hypothetical protein TCDM_04271 [Trypanosoma cruzi Dm28c]